jgi:curved DNA-binding protein CbpA
LKDYYQILNVDKRASDKEIKSSFRKLAVIHHPDKNGGSKKSEEIFKSILVAYETLIDTQKRAVYDIKFNQFHRQKITPPKPRPEPTYSTSKQEYKRPTQQSQTANPKKEERKPKNNSWLNLRFGIFIFLILIEVIYLFSREPSTTSATGNIGTPSTSEKSKTDQELERQKPKEPTAGELDFQKE